MGKRFATRWLRQFQGDACEAHAVRRLAELAVDSTGHLPMVVAVAEPDPESDALALAALSRRSGRVTVLAAFSPEALCEPWSLDQFVLSEGWQEVLFRWAQARLSQPEQLADAPAKIALSDPDRSRVISPGDLMTMLRRIHLGMMPKAATLAALSKEWLRLRVASDSQWLAAHGAEAVRQLIRNRFEDVARFVVPLAIDDWTDLFPSERARRRSPEELASEIARLRKPKRAPTTDEVQSLLVLGSRDGVELLVKAGLLRWSGVGLEVFPNWIRAGIEEELVAESLASRDDLRWARWSVEVTRRHSVDRALDLLTLSELARWTGLVLDRSDDSLEVIAGSEALFSAWGRRALARAANLKPHQALLQRLGERQLDLIAIAREIHPRIRLGPLTRNVPSEWLERSEVDSYCATWLAEAWAFSFAVSPGQGDRASWALPGWSLRLDLSQADLPNEGLIETHESPPWSHLIRLGRDVVPRCLASGQWDAFDVRVLLPWLLLDGAPVGDPRPADLLDEVSRAVPQTKSIYRYASEPWRGDFVIDTLLEARASNSQHAVVASALFAFLLEGPRLPWRALNRRDVCPKVSSYIREHLPLEDFQASIDALARGKRIDLGEESLELLPVRFRRPTIELLLRWQSESGATIDRLREALVPTLGRDDFDIIARLARIPFTIGDDAARLGWQLDPEQAWREVDARIATGDCPGSWFIEAPAEHLSGLLDRLDVYRGPPLKWFNRFLVSALPRAGTLAPRVFAMLMIRAQALSSVDSEQP